MKNLSLLFFCILFIVSAATSDAYQPYKQLVLFAQKIAATPRGDGTYQNLTGLDVDKKAYWSSVSLYGVSWRLVGIH